MARKGDFSKKIKHATIQRQDGICAFCGVTLKTPWTDGDFPGNAHHLQPLLHSGSDIIENCVYLCWGHHQLIGHGMAPFEIDEQGGSSSSWVQLSKDDFEYWDGGPDENAEKS